MGLWLWKGGLFPQERELVWALGEGRESVRTLEIQLWDEDGQLLKREQFFFQAAPAQVIQKVPLKEGRYTARIFLERAGKPEAEQRVRPVEIGEAEAYGLSISGRR